MSCDLSWGDLTRAAYITTRVLKRQGYTSCVFGGVAASLQAEDITRIPSVRMVWLCYLPSSAQKCVFPKDLDIAVMTDDDAERVKEAIEDADERFYTQSSRFTSKTHRKLFFRLPGYSFDERRVLKVDILVPPTVGIPWVYPSSIDVINNIPVMPIFPLLVLKIRGWWFHRRSRRPDFRVKEPGDVEDIRCLLTQAGYEGINLYNERDTWDCYFIEVAENTVRRLLEYYPNLVEGFETLDFDV